ncbi:hypothetical protein I7I51_03612 [Histoplasma capsulatum]|uniref:Uncharacterized protein n=1 Tax=Ajellomyces capsulatus TaxID=5037 RepID=A0A8A1MB95_AJECA|nr:hypothetical protein I7I51_03612 [Histoplasma capsulatum]
MFILLVQDGPQRDVVEVYEQYRIVFRSWVWAGRPSGVINPPSCIAHTSHNACVNFSSSLPPQLQFAICISCSDRQHSKALNIITAVTLWLPSTVAKSSDLELSPSAAQVNPSPVSLSLLSPLRTTAFGAVPPNQPLSSPLLSSPPPIPLTLSIGIASLPPIIPNP